MRRIDRNGTLSLTKGKAAWSLAVAGDLCPIGRSGPLLAAGDVGRVVDSRIL